MFATFGYVEVFFYFTFFVFTFFCLTSCVCGFFFFLSLRRTVCFYLCRWLSLQFCDKAPEELCLVAALFASYVTIFFAICGAAFAHFFLLPNFFVVVATAVAICTQQTKRKTVI